MNFKFSATIFIFVVFFLGILPKNSVVAQIKPSNMTIIYMTTNHQPSPDVLIFEATLSAFADHIDLISVNDVSENTIRASDVLVFFGEEKGKIPQAALDVINSFSGQIIAVGENIDQLSPYNHWEFSETNYIRNIDGESLAGALPIKAVNPPKDSTILSVGVNVDHKFPLIVKQGRLAYFALTIMNKDTKYVISKSLYPILHVKPPTSHKAYIRLEDISPITDPKLLKAEGDYLADRGIPFYQAVIPVYVHPETGELKKLSENKELVKVLTYLQKRGGMVIAHGYTHSYRKEETGEGFEFWDTKLNQKITIESPEAVPDKLRSSVNFSTEEDYQQYIKPYNQIERTYIENRHTKSIEDLTALGLYPLAFEAPHYAMSAHGYEVTSNFFSSIFGQIQLSDENWEVMNAPVFISKPFILNRMTLYPETIGYIDPTLADPFAEMEESIKRLQEVPGSVIGGFYHPYIGMDYLPQMVEMIESIPNVEWLDLTETAQSVQTKYVKIRQEPEQPLQVAVSMNGKERLLEKYKEQPLEFVLWILAIVVALTVLIFFIYIFWMRARLRIRLFEERK